MSLHVECGLAAVRSSAPVEDGGSLRWSETVASAGTTGNAVPDNEPGVIFYLTLTAEVNMWVSIGASPNAGANPRRRMLANTQRSFSAPAGAKVAWA